MLQLLPGRWYNIHMPSEEDTIKLLPGERLVKIEPVPVRRMSEKPSSLQQMFRLTDADNEDEVGANGPAVAALAIEDSDTSSTQNLYNTVFGRDSLRVAIDLVAYYPRLARSTLRTLAELQGTGYDEHREEEPGRIVHEARNPHDPLALELTRTRGWHWPYYGSVDATPEFIRTMHAYCTLNEHTKQFLHESYITKNGDIQPLHHALTSAVEWLTNRLDQNPEGLLEYRSELAHGIENQVWKDSWDAYHHSDGRLANHGDGIASIEVQSVTHEALLDAADMYESQLYRRREAQELRVRAKRLSRQILDLFWTDDKDGYFVLGLDRDEIGNPRQLAVRTSNMGHVLNSRVLDGDEPERVHKRSAILRQLQSPELLTVSGIRTLASDEIRYREGAYHNGSVWIWDTHHIAKGARRYLSDPLFTEFADELDRRILTVVDEIGGFPEYVRGGATISVNDRIVDVEDTINDRINRIEQPPQEVQAWTVAAILATKRRRARRGLL